MVQQNVVLTGFMGTGKSTIGRMLAKQLKYRFVDTDKLIESRQNVSIAQIFAEQGEAAFRAMETEIARELGSAEKLVISTGGKMLLDAVNREYLERNGRIFCLIADTDEIVQRLLKSRFRSKRPLLQASDPAKKIRELLQERESGYRQFEQIDTSGKTPSEICRFLLELYLQESG